jgi:hypothetical protein
MWKGRRDPVYVLALPLLLACGRGIFLDLNSLHLPLGGGVTVNQEDVLLLAQLGVFVYVLGLRPAAAPSRLTIQLYLCLGILILLTGKAFAAYFSSWDDLTSPGILVSVAKAGAVARLYFYVPMSIMLWHLILKRFSAAEILHLVRIITWVTAACSVVYLANLAGLRTYTSIWPAYYTTRAPGGDTVIRDYLTMPFWLYLALGYSLARLVYGGQRLTYLLLGIVITGCAVFSFTRSYAMCALGLWALAGFWKAVIVPSQRKTVRPRARVSPARAWILTSAFGVLGGAVLVRWSTLASWWAYLATRFGTLTRGQGGDPNTELRVNLFHEASRTVAHSGFFLGTLMTSGAAATGVYYLDSYWAAVLVDLGWIGLFVMAALAVTALSKTVANALKAEGESAVLGLAILSGLAAAIVLSFTGAWLAFAVVAGTFLLAVPDVRPLSTPARPQAIGRAAAETR